MGQKFLKIEDKIQDRESENFLIFVIFLSPTFMALFWLWCGKWSTPPKIYVYNYVYNYILDKAEITTLHNMKDVCEGWQSSLRFILIGYENSVSAYLQK